MKIEKKDHNELIRKTLPVIKRYLMRHADKAFKDDEDRFDFVMSAAINLLGNLTMQSAGRDLDEFEHLSSKTMHNLIIWYEQAEILIKNKKGSH